MSAATDLHNKLAGEIVRAIVKPVVDRGGSTAEIMVLTESVLFGIALICIRLGGDNVVLDVMVENVRRRLAETRLGPIPPAGSA